MKNEQSFTGFTPQTIQFLKDLKENNYKEWFEEHRMIYENELLKPFKALATALTPAMYNIDPVFDFRIHRILSRIYRDVRFSKNKEPYKTCMWMSFQVPTKEWEDVPGFFMELNEESYFYGMGLFMPKKKTMDSLRDSIAYDSQEFEEQTQRVLERGFVIGGEEYKRLLKNDLSAYFQQWVQRKSLYVYKQKAINDELFTASLVDIIREDYESVGWLYDFLKNE